MRIETAAVLQLIGSGAGEQSCHGLHISSGWRLPVRPAEHWWRASADCAGVENAIIAGHDGRVWAASANCGAYENELVDLIRCLEKGDEASGGLPSVAIA